MKESFYLSLARKYRPTSFEDVVGQKFVSKSLLSAIKNKKVPQSLLFSGPRGVGKTTCARILARKLNEEFADDPKDLSFDVFELDGASNNSVEDIRSLIEQVRFAPQRGKYKVYIIDEVHMLSQSAFNAFLKTLEEPPPYIVFVLATTEKHKVLPTILSRCQNYEFSPVSARTIAEHLNKIILLENVQAEQEALFLIASKAEGSLRDALFLLDRFILLSDGVLKTEIIENQLGILPTEHYLELTNLLKTKNLSLVFMKLEEIINKGYDKEIFLMDLASHFRNLLIAKEEKTHFLIQCSEEIKKKIIYQSIQIESEFLLSALFICKKAQLEIKSSKNTRLSLEIALIEIAHMNLLDERKKSNNAPSYLPGKNSSEILERAKSQQVETTEEVIISKKKEEVYKKPIYNSKPDTKESFSIKETLEKTKEELVIEEEKKVYKNYFSEEEFKKYWNKFIINELKSNKIISEIIKSVRIKILPDYKVVLTFFSQLSVNEFREIENKMLKYLKENLLNSYIEFEYKIGEAPEDHIPYTEQEKYKFLLKKNSMLGELIEKIDLDSDF